VQTYGAWKYSNNNQVLFGWDWSFSLLLMLMIFSASFLYSIYKAGKSSMGIQEGVNGHLAWNRSKPVIGNARLYLFGLLIPLIITKQWALLVIGILTLFYSLYSYKKSGESSSMWCFFGILYAIVSIIV